MATIDSVKLPDNSTYDLTDNHSGYAKKVAGATTDDLASLTATGDLADSGKKLSDLVLKSDVKDVLNSTSTTDPLSANQGRVLNENVKAIVDVYGSKNLFIYPYSAVPSGGNGMTFTDVGDGTITISGIASADTFIYLHDPSKIYLKNGQYKLSGTPHFGDTVKLRLYLAYKDTSNNTVVINVDNNTATRENTFTINGSYGDVNGAACNAYIKIFNGADCSTPVTFCPMIRDDRIVDDTFVPYAKTNQQLTADKAERSDLATLNLTGSTNSTGSQINAGTFFYLNGSFCKALTNIAVNATFTLNTNYKEDTVGAEIKAVENKDTSSFSVSTESGVSLQKAICRNGFVYLQLNFAALANSTKIATITDANYLPEGGMAVGLIEPNLAAEKINYTYGSFSGSNVYVYVSGSPTSGGIITFVYPVTGY